MKSLIVHSEAELELWQAVAYYEEIRQGLGLDLEREVRQTFSEIQSDPQMWHQKKYGTRCRLLKRFPYAIYFFELDTLIWIVAIAHTRRRPYYWRRRLKDRR